MSGDLRLVIFDVDGTLVDSQSMILFAMAAAFDAVNEPVPEPRTLLGVVGLSLDVIFPILSPGLSAAAHQKMVDAYKNAYMSQRARAGVQHSAPFYAGARETLEALHAIPEVLLGVATGKSKRGLDKLIEGHGLHGLFATRQVADFHPSKPDPSMIHQAMAEVGVAPEHTVMIGDTSFDMEMAANAGVRGIGVTWGYHDRAQLKAASVLVENYDDLQTSLSAQWSVPV